MAFLKKYEFSIIIPVFRETGIINKLLNSILERFNQEALEIIIVDGENNRDTINKISIDSYKIRKIVSEKSRAKQMNAGAAVSEGDILIFLHADCSLPENALCLIKNILASYPDIAAGAFGLKIDSDRIIFKIISRLSSARSRITKIPYGDQAIFIRKEFFHKIGGYNEIPVMEDIDLMRRIKKNKGRIFIIPKTVTASARRFEKEGIFYRVLKNRIIAALYFFGVSPHRLKILYRGDE